MSDVPGPGATLPCGFDDPATATDTPSVARNNGMNERKKFSTRLAAGLLLAILFDTALQLVWKSAVLALPHDGCVNAILRNPLFIFVIFLMGCQFFNWLMVLSEADLRLCSTRHVLKLCLGSFLIRSLSKRSGRCISDNRHHLRAS
jgi:hypothetical protein